ncbi:MAG TPA: S9 family peptidase [Vicinamibacterales bacterium]|nr:S9 family peptidase [Vicinamibacterales bacterium]
MTGVNQLKRASARARLAAIAVCCLVLPAAAQQKRSMTERDLFAFVWVADPQISADGSQVAFVRVTANEKTDAYDTDIWVVAADGRDSARQLTRGTADSAPRWSPDGRQLAFVRSVQRDGRPQPPQLFVLALDGGEPRQITDIPRGAGNPVWSPDGRTIAFTSTARAEDLAQKQDRPRESDVRVITDPVYRANAVGDWGYIDPQRPPHIWTVAISDPAGPAATPRPITSGTFTEANVQWSPDGKQLYFVSNRDKELSYRPEDADLYSVPATGGEVVRRVSIDGPIGDYALSADGSRVAFIGALTGTPPRSYSQPDLFVAALASEVRLKADTPGTASNLTAAYDFDADGGLAGDQRPPRGGSPSAPVWSRDGSSILIKAGEQGAANMKRVDVATGKVDAVTTGNQEVMAYTADARGENVALVLSTQTVVGDLHLLNAGSRATRRLTSFNDRLFGQLQLSEPEEITYPSFDGRTMQGWIMKPPGFEASRKYPLVLQIHGGPHAAYGNTFTHEFQWMAAQGYVVLFTNPRGSSNYGQDFGNIIQFKYPGDDYKDLMAGVDALLKRGYIDEARMGVTGGSGGGLLTNWVVTQTNRFKAAVSQRDISDWTGFWYTSDFWTPNVSWFVKAPFEDPQEYAARSPITYVRNIQTPIMFILGDEDWRTPPSAGGEQLFRALKYLKRPTVMIRFPDETHELSRSGKPWHRVERLQHIVGWMDKYLLGKNAGKYE